MALQKIHGYMFSLIAFIAFSFNLQGQQLINGGMEQWDTTYTPFPVSWLTNGFFATHLCNPYIPLTGERTTDKLSGNYAVKIESKDCIDDMFIQQVYMGLLAYGNNSNPKLAHGIPYTQRPEQLNFNYKFKRVGTDTALVKIVLRALDNNGYAGQIIGEGRVWIVNETNVYTPMSVPINYTSSNNPEIIQVLFSTSKKLAQNDYFPINASVSSGIMSIGTTLWVDDVNLSGGAIGIYEHEKTSMYKLYPNPVNDASILVFENPSHSDHTLKIYDAQGALKRTITSITGNTVEINRKDLASGLYFFQLSGEKQASLKGKFIIE